MNEKYPLALPQGTVLAGQYIVEEVLGQGGFGITYKATDHKSGKKVAIKEFFPDAMATRTTQSIVTPFSGERGESFAYGKTCFLQEAETLANFIGNENIIRVHSYFEENGTAYFVMEYIEGVSFDEYLKRQGGKIPFEDAARILVPVMDALIAVHSKGVIHRDISPDNIFITNEGVVKLLDFGAARYSLGDQSRSLDVILKHGFAPKEQYTRRGRQGPYTDIYALGATYYFALTGKRPPDSVERMDEDDLVPPSSLGVQISRTAEDAILKALAVQPADRFQSMAAFKDALLGEHQPATVQSPSPGQNKEESPTVVQTFFHAPEQTDQPPTSSWTSQTPRTEQAPPQPQPQPATTTSGNPGGKGPASKKFLFIPVAAVAVIALIVVFAVRPGGTKVKKSDSSEPPQTSPETTAITYAQEAENGNSSSESSAPLDESFTLVGNYSGNIMNGGYVTAQPGIPIDQNVKFTDIDCIYYINRSQQEILSNQKTLIELDSTDYVLSNLLYDDGFLYFLVGQNEFSSTAYFYNTSTREYNEISYLYDFSGRIRRMFLTRGYYVIGCTNENGENGNTTSVYLVSRSDGQVTACCEGTPNNSFTLTDDGYLYYITYSDDSSEKESVYSIYLPTMEMKGILATEEFQLSCPIVTGDYLYLSCIKKSDNTQYGYLQTNRMDGSNLHFRAVSKGLNLGNAASHIDLNVSPTTQDVFFQLTDTSQSRMIYMIEESDDGKMSVTKNFPGYSPSIIVNNDGIHYKLICQNGGNEDGID